LLVDYKWPTGCTAQYIGIYPDNERYNIGVTFAKSHSSTILEGN